MTTLYQSKVKFLNIIKLYYFFNLSYIYCKNKVEKKDIAPELNSI